IQDFLNNTNDKTLLICGVADKEKHISLLKALNSQGKQRGLVDLIHTTKDGMESFFRWAGLYKVKVPSKYGQEIKLSNLTISFDNLSTKGGWEKYDSYAFDFMIVWPIQSVTKNNDEIQMLKEMSVRQKTKKIIYLTIKEPWYNPEPLKAIVDRTIKLDCENDDPHEYQRIMAAYQEDLRIQEQRNRFM
ncbi:MAG: hypothetical protein RR275_09325, partial [Lachnospiraceae bacterium]